MSVCGHLNDGSLMLGDCNYDLGLNSFKTILNMKLLKECMKLH